MKLRSRVLLATAVVAISIAAVTLHFAVGQTPPSSSQASRSPAPQAAAEPGKAKAKSASPARVTAGPQVRVRNNGTGTKAGVTPPAGGEGALSPQVMERIAERAKERERERETSAGDDDKNHPHDQPAEATQFELKKRLPAGQSVLPVERYQVARDHNNTMPRYSSTIARQLPSVQASGPADIANVNTILSSWANLGPGNIGGRVRALLIDPTTPTTMYTAGVAGGIWKTTTGGTTWSPLSDFLSNIAVNSMAMDPANSNVIYTGTGEGNWNIDAIRGAGIFKTTDGGSTWTALASTTSSSDFYFVNKLAVSPVNSNRVYAGTRTGIWRSTNAGVNWTKVLDSTSNYGCFDLAMRTDQTTDYIFASCGTFAQAKIYRNTDAAGAGTWTSVYTETNMGLTSLAIAPSNQSTIYALAASLQSGNYQDGLLAVFRSTSNGDSGSWTAQVRNTSTTKLNTLLLTNPVIASETDCGYSGNSYNNQGWYDNIIAVDPVNPNVVWAGGIDLFRSDDGGANWGVASYWWAGITAAGYAHADQHAITFHPQYNGTTNKIMFVGGDGGLFKTTNARAAVATGSTAVCNSTNTSIVWSNLNSNIGITQFYDGTVTPDGGTYFGGTQDNGTDLGTNSLGANAWHSIMGGDGGYVAVDPGSTSVMYAEYTGLSLQKSINGGTSWSGATSGISGDNGFMFIVPFTMDSNSSTKLWIGGSSLWRTINGASGWTQASAAMSDSSSISAITVAPGNSNIVAAGTSSGKVLVHTSALSATSASTWPSTQPRTSAYVSWVAFDPANSNILYATYATFKSSSSDAQVYRSPDRGATWSPIGGSGAGTLPDIPVHCIVVDPTIAGRLYIGTDLGVYTTIDYGVTWNLEVTSFANVTTQRLLINTISSNKTLFAFTHGRGVFKAPITGGTGSTATMATPTPGSTLSGASVTFTWNAGSGGTAYWLDVGTAAGQGNIFGQNVGLVTSQTVNGIPTNGATIYVRLWTQLSGTWQYNDYTYTAAAKAVEFTPPPGSTFGGASVAFTWSAGSGASAYWLDVGTAVGQGNIFGQNVGLATSQTVNGIPTNGATIYVRLWTQLSGTWLYNDYTYTAASFAKAVMSIPTPGSTFGGASVAFTWSAGSGASAYWLDVGTAVGQGNIFGQNVALVTSRTVTGIPTNGATIYVRLWTLLGSTWSYNDYTYTAYSGALTKAVMSTPVPGSTFSGASVTFNWSAGSGASAYWLDVGTAVGVGNIFGQNVALVTSQTVNGIPTNGATIYVRLWTLLGTWQYNDYTYTAYNGTFTKAVMSGPVADSTLSGASVTFSWLAGSGASTYWLDVGTVLGQGNIFGQNVGLVTSQTVNGIPTNGATIYVRLWTLEGSTWLYNDYTYTAAGTLTKAVMSTPAPGSTLSGASVTFTWSAGSGASAYWLDVGTVAGQGNIFGQNVGLVTSRTVTGIPTNSAPIYVRLWTLLGSTWLYNDYTYTASGGF